jgi:hypothetical protein
MDKNKFRCMDRDKLSRLRGKGSEPRPRARPLRPAHEPARNGLQDIRFQLDRLCALARAERPRIDRPGRNQPTTQLPR